MPPKDKMEDMKITFEDGTFQMGMTVGYQVILVLVLVLLLHQQQLIVWIQEWSLIRHISLVS
jgi:hypothetical protein